MKKFALLIVGMCFAASASLAGFLDKDTLILRADYLYDDESGSTEAHGGELGFGTALYPFDEVAVFVSYLDGDDLHMQRVGIGVVEHYKLPAGIPIAPFAGVSVGYNLTDVAGQDKDLKDWFFRLEGGLKIIVTDWMSVSASAHWLYALDDVFVNRTETVDQDWNFAFGLRFYY